jgi:hypothetical protein
MNVSCNKSSKVSIVNKAKQRKGARKKGKINITRNLNIKGRRLRRYGKIMGESNVGQKD